MKLLILVSCFCLQLASAPAAKAICLDGPASLKAPDSGSGKIQTQAPVFIRPPAPEIFSSPATFLGSLLERFPSFLGPKDFLIRTGLSPPFVIG